MKRFLLLLLLTPFVAHSQLLRVKDINTTIYGGQGNPQSFVEFKGALYFIGTNHYGTELWKTDGTVAGTVMVKDINLGTQNGLLSTATLTPMGDYLYFPGNDGVNGSELWRSDGTALGTTLVFDINTGSGSSLPSYLTVMNNVLYFQASNGAGTGQNGEELWKYDGTNAPVMVMDINVGIGNSSPTNLTVMNNVLYFQASNGTTTGLNGVELWKYDGTNAPQMVYDIATGTASSSPTNIKVMNNVLYFQASNGTTTGLNGAELWKYDGTAAPSMVADIQSGTGSSSPNYLTVLNNVLYFSANNGTAANGAELWKYDGTNAPSMVFDINSGTASSSPSYLYVYNNVLYFSATTASTGFEMWVYDPTSGFDPYVIEIYSGTSGSISGNPYFIGYNGNIYLQAQSSTGGYELYKYNPINTTVSLVKDINTSSATGASYPKYFTLFNSKILFQANDKEGGADNTELWISDGTENGTSRLIDIYPGSDAAPQYFTISNGSIFFAASNGLVSAGKNGTELWKTDGTEVGTNMVADINTSTINNAGSSSPYYLTDVNGTLFFAATNGTDGNEIFTSGISGTNMVKNLYVGNVTNNNAIGAYANTNIPVKFRNNFLIKATSDAAFTELFKCDGTDAGTVAVSAFANAGVSINNLTVVGDSLFFSANETGQGYELWVYNGTSTTMIPAVNATAAQNSINASVKGPLVEKYKGEYYYAAGTVTTNIELYRYNKGTNTSSLVSEINSGGSSSPFYFTELNGKLLFIATDATNGTELFYTDASTTGLVKDITSGSASTFFSTSFNGFYQINSTTMLFFANNRINGEELWKTDGTAAGTLLVKDINAGAGSSIFSSTTAIINGKMYFIANETLWVSDGTEAGTYCVARKAGGAFDPSSQVIAYNNEVYLVAVDSEGKELYKYTPINTPSAQASTINFTNKTNNSITINWTNGDGLNRVVFLKQGSDVPTNGPEHLTSFSASNNWGTKGSELYVGSGYFCIYNGTGSSISVSGLNNNTQYTAYVFEYNGTNGYQIYNKTINSSNSGSVTTKNIQTITFDPLSSKTYGDGTFNLTATASSALTVTYTSSDPLVASIVGNTVTINKAGSTVIMASQSGDENYISALDVQQTLTVDKANQIITFGTLEAKTFGNAAFDLTASTSSTLAISYTSSDPSVATVNGNTVTIVGAGTTTITATQSGDVNYNSATPVIQTLTVNKADQAITFGALTSKTFGNAPFDLTAIVSSPLVVSYTSSDPAVATIVGSTVTIVGAGTTTITASQIGNTNYNAATPVPQALTVNKADQTITFGVLSTKTFGNAAFDLTATTSSTLSVVFASSNPEVASISGNTVTIVGAGTTTITASQIGNTNYNAATPVPQTLTVNKADQTITFGILPTKTFGNAAFDLTATASSTLSVVFASSNPAVATISGNTVTIVGAGTTTITASQAGNANFNSAVNVTQLLTINKADQIITFGALSPKTVGDAAFNLNATASSGLAVSYSSSNSAVATISGNTVTIIGSGTTSITSSQTGNNNYNAAANVEQVLTVSPKTGIFDIDNNNVKVYPNPAQGSISIDLGVQFKGYHKIKFVNIIGVVVMESLLTSSVQTFDINDLRPGIYIVTIEIDNSTVTKKFIVK